MELERQGNADCTHLNAWKHLHSARQQEVILRALNSCISQFVRIPMVHHIFHLLVRVSCLKVAHSSSSEKSIGTEHTADYATSVLGLFSIIRVFCKSQSAGVKCTLKVVGKNITQCNLYTLSLEISWPQDLWQ